MFLCVDKLHFNFEMTLLEICNSFFFTVADLHYLRLRTCTLNNLKQTSQIPQCSHFFVFIFPWNQNQRKLYLHTVLVCESGVHIWLIDEKNRTLEIGFDTCNLKGQSHKKCVFAVVQRLGFQMKPHINIGKNIIAN